MILNLIHLKYVGDETFTTDSIIAATGATAKLLGLESEKELMGMAYLLVLHVMVSFSKIKKFFIGGGDSAMEEANF